MLISHFTALPVIDTRGNTNASSASAPSQSSPSEPEDRSSFDEQTLSHQESNTQSITDNASSEVNLSQNNGSSLTKNEEATHDEEDTSEDKQAEPYSNYTDEELQIIEQLKTREAEVIAHEQAHAAVGGQYTGPPNYDYQTGPNGVRYAVSGEVSIDTSEIPGDPEATLQKAKQIKAAALAPADPSAQDLKVAAKADRMAANARAEIISENNGVDRNSANNLENNGKDKFNEEKNTNSEQNEDESELMKTRGVYIEHYYNGSSQNRKLATFELTI